MKILTARATRATGLQLSIVVLAAIAVTGAATSVAGPQRQTPKTDFGSIVKTESANLGTMRANATMLRQEIDNEASQFADSARNFGSRLTAAERRDLQGACESVVASDGDARSQRRLQSLLARYKSTAPETVLRFCLDRSYTRLRNEVAASVTALERTSETGAEAQANVELQNSLQRQQQTLTTLSNIMKTRHDTAKNAISNVR
jgi:hypothetical protein